GRAPQDDAAVGRHARRNGEGCSRCDTQEGDGVTARRTGAKPSDMGRVLKLADAKSLRVVRYVNALELRTCRGYAQWKLAQWREWHQSRRRHLSLVSGSCAPPNAQPRGAIQPADSMVEASPIRRG